MEKNRNPSSRECLSPWSELPLDLLTSAFERLVFADYQRGKLVCSSWYSCLRQFVPKNHIPWLILFPKQNNDNFCTLFNPKGKDKLYKTKDLGLEFGKSVCVTTYGNWLLMQDPLFNLYIVNLFTQEIINLPPVESKIEDKKSVFWIDEKTKDYVVIWGREESCVVYYKKGDTLWQQIPGTSDFFDMVYNNHKLYFLSRVGSFKAFDFSGMIPREIYQCVVVMDKYVVGPHPIHTEYWVTFMEHFDSWNVAATKLVVTVKGDVLKVDKMSRYFWKTPEWSFCIYKVYSSASGFLKKCEQVDSLGHEVMLFDLGITVIADDVEGFDRNSVCFIHNKAMLLFNIGTRKAKKLDNFHCPSIDEFSRARWFLPSFMKQD